MTGQQVLEEIAYNAAVQGFGSRIRSVRQRRKLKMTDVAREALGRDASKVDVRDFANYLSKVELEHPDAQNPSLDKLEQIAAGLGLTLSAFFLHLEQSQNSSLIAISEKGKDPTVLVDDARALSAPLVVDANGLVTLGRIIGRAIRDAARDRQAAASRKRQS